MFTGAVLVNWPLPPSLLLCSRRIGPSRRRGGGGPFRTPGRGCEGCEGGGVPRGGWRARGGARPAEGGGALSAQGTGRRPAPPPPRSHVSGIPTLPLRPVPGAAAGLGSQSLLSVSSPASAGAHVPVRSCDTGMTLTRRGPWLRAKGAARPCWRYPGFAWAKRATGVFSVCCLQWELGKSYFRLSTTRYKSCLSCSVP